MKTHFIVQGFETKMESGSLVDTCIIDVFAKTEKEAIDKAKKYIKKSHYRVSDIIEK